MTFLRRLYLIFIRYNGESYKIDIYLAAHVVTEGDTRSQFNMGKICSAPSALSLLVMPQAPGNDSCPSTEGEVLPGKGCLRWYIIFYHFTGSKSIMTLGRRGVAWSEGK